MMELSTICKLEILHQYIFRNSNPAVFGVRVLSGKIKSNIPLINELDESVGRIKSIQSGKESIHEATPVQEVAISIPGSNFDRKLSEAKFLYSEITENQFKKFKKNKDLLSPDELKTLQEISDFKRKKNGDWGL